MLSLDEGSQIPAYVEQTLLTWVRLHPGFQTTADIVELTNGKFFLVLLQTLQNFKLLSPLSQLNDDHHLAAKVSIIKNISKSLNYFHQTELHRDVSQFEINCVQLCMGNKKQLLRLITIVLSAVYSQVSSKLAVQQQMSRLSQQQYEVLRIMVQNSLNLGQECESCCSRSWRLSQQKKVFLKMETLENKIEQLEILNKNLEQMLRTQKEAEQTAVQQSKKLKQQIKRLLILNDQLVESNEKTINELKISSIEQGTTKKKFEVVKSKLQQKISKLQEQVHKLLQTSHQNKILSQKIAKITQINTEIKQQNKCLRQNLNKLEHEKAELKLLNKAHNQQFLILKQHCSELEIKVQELMLACSIKMSGQAENSYQRTCFFGNLQLESGSQSNRYRIAENLGWLNNQLSCSQQLVEDNKIKRDNKFQIRTITQRSLEDSICLQHLKQNQSILMNNSQIQSFPPSFALQNSQKKSQPQSIKKSNNSFSISQYENLQRQYIEQIKILTCVILDLQMQLEEANKRNPIVCMSNDSVAGKRMEKFKSKVKEMFGKGSKVESQ